MEAVSHRGGRTLLPSVANGTRVMHRMVDAGAVDGTTGDRKYYVDGFTTEENGALLTRLHAAVGG